MNVLVAYASIEGQTRKISDFVAELLRMSGHTVIRIDTAQENAVFSFEDVERIILLASIHRQRHPPEFEKFVRSNREALRIRDTLLISVSLCAAFEEGRSEAAIYVADFNSRTGFTANHTALTGGALQFRKYKDYEAQVVRLIGLHLERYESMSCDREFTDWKALRKEVSAFLND